MYDEKKIEEIITSFIEGEIDNTVEESFLTMYPEIIKIQSKIEFRSIVYKLLEYFIYLVGISSIIFIVVQTNQIQNINLLNESTMLLIKDLNLVDMLLNYIYQSILILVIYSIFSFTYRYLTKDNYSNQKAFLHKLKNFLYVFFIISFFLKSFTVEQLDFVSLVVTTVLLFGFIFQEKNSLNEEYLKNKIRQKHVNLLLHEIESSKDSKEINKT